ncbi:MAG: 23S rRNA (uracil(1939)-C(5))-methyltransferase RlmD, partial [Burkholderiales bacterium]
MAVASVESLDHEGRGIAHVEGKAVFIDGALPGERVVYSSYRKKPTYESATLSRLIGASAQRVEPRCRYFGVCGGCSMQHLDAAAQVAVKQRVLEDALLHIGRVAPETVLPAVQGQYWQYRHRARLAARYVAKKNTVLAGFHEKRSSFVADMRDCAVLPHAVAGLLTPLRELITTLSVRDRIPQIETALDEHGTVLVLRVLVPLSVQDHQVLRRFADEQRVQLYLQPHGAESAAPYYPAQTYELHYPLKEFGLDFYFQPSEFTQINPHINAILVRRAMALLEPQPGERIADLFCGIGNFSLPAAKRGAAVVGVEGCAALVRSARANAQRNGLEDSV